MKEPECTLLKYITHIVGLYQFSVSFFQSKLNAQICPSSIQKVTYPIVSALFKKSPINKIHEGMLLK